MDKGTVVWYDHQQSASPVLGTQPFSNPIVWNPINLRDIYLANQYHKVTYHVWLLRAIVYQIMVVHGDCVPYNGDCGGFVSRIMEIEAVVYRSMQIQGGGAQDTRF